VLYGKISVNIIDPNQKIVQTSENIEDFKDLKIDVEKPV